MTVAELVRKLQDMPQDVEVVSGLYELMPVEMVHFNDDANWWSPSDGSKGGYHTGRVVEIG